MDLSPDKLHVFIMLIVPGIIALKVHDLLVPPAKRDLTTSLLDAAAIGLVNYGILIVPMQVFGRREFVFDHPVWAALIGFFMLVAFPTFLAYAYFKVRTSQYMSKWIGYVTKTSWDDIFSRRPLKYFVICHLKSDKKKVAGLFGPLSYATTFPSEPEVYLEEAWRLDEQDRFKEKVDGTRGVIVKFSECAFIEFFKVEEIP